MTQYQINKEKARRVGIRWQLDFASQRYSYNELWHWQIKLEKLAKKFGLIKEFKENGII